MTILKLGAEGNLGKLPRAGDLWKLASAVGCNNLSQQ